MAGELKGYTHGANRPAQKGRVVGIAVAGGTPHAVKVEWLVDTGSSICSIPKRIANQFATRAAAGGGTVLGLGSSTKLVRVNGLKVEFTIDDGTTAGEVVLVPQTVALVDPQPLAPEQFILGMHALVLAKARIEWNPGKPTGRLVKITP